MNKKIEDIQIRGLKKRVFKAKGKSVSSTKWLRRQINDPYVVQAKKLGYRSRAAFKLREIDDRFKFLNPGKRVVDLGAAPGGWSQVAIERVNALGSSAPPVGKVVSIDRSEIETLPGANILKIDITEETNSEKIKLYLGGLSDVVLSDMASPATGHTSTDHIRIMGLLELAFNFAQNVLSPNGVFLGKVLKGGTENTLLNQMKKNFKMTKHIKPKASRQDSRESYIIATGFYGN